MVFFNKSDILEKKIEAKNSDIRKYFPEYEGDPFNLNQVKAYMVAMFDEVRRNQRQEFYHYFTTATNTTNIQMVFDIVKDIILSGHIGEIMQI